MGFKGFLLGIFTAVLVAQGVLAASTTSVEREPNSLETSMAAVEYKARFDRDLVNVFLVMGQSFWFSYVVIGHSVLFPEMDVWGLIRSASVFQLGLLTGYSYFGGRTTVPIKRLWKLNQIRGLLSKPIGSEGWLEGLSALGFLSREIQDPSKKIIPTSLERLLYLRLVEKALRFHSQTTWENLSESLKDEFVLNLLRGVSSVEDLALKQIDLPLSLDAGQVFENVVWHALVIRNIELETIEKLSHRDRRDLLSVLKSNSQPPSWLKREGLFLKRCARSILSSFHVGPRLIQESLD